MTSILPMLSILASAAPLQDMNETFNLNASALTGTSRSYAGHSGTWVSGTTGDTWGAYSNFGGWAYSRASGETGTWGGANEDIDDHLTYTGREWHDLTLDTDVYVLRTNDGEWAPGGEDTVGVVFRWQDNSNFYVAFTSRDRIPAVGGGARTAPGTYLYRIRNGVATELGFNAAYVGYNNDTPFRVVAVGATISVYLDRNNDEDVNDAGELMFTKTDSSPILTNGRVGLYNFGAGGSDNGEWSSVRVTIDDKDTDGDAIPDARDNCRTIANSSQTDANGNRIGDACEDIDGDGFAPPADCNDLDKNINPGAAEVCDDVDSDCDGDKVDGATDTDGDKAPDCVDPDDDGDGVADGSDCKPVDKAIYPGATDVCDAIDQDCDGDLVESYGDFDKDKSPDCADADDDNDTDPDTSDCNDADTSISLLGVEVCDAIDQDCNGSVVESYPDFDTDKSPDCVDADDDNDVDPDVSDCDDADKTVYTDATEICDAIDQDCDGNVRESFADFDNDNTADCIDPDDDNDADPDGSDCNDADDTVHTGAVESSCDTVDSDCDGSITDGSAGDFDGDANPDCTDPDDDNDGSLDAADCDDFDKKVFPGAAEVCDAIDADCDNDLVDGAPDADADKQPNCIDPDDDNDGSLDAADCAPLDKTVRPGAVESCDTIDSDCDKSLVDTFTNFDSDGEPDCIDADDDNDKSADTLDCNDASAAVYPGAAEVCDLVDSNCNQSLVDTFLDTDVDKSPDCVDADDDADGDPDTADCGPLNKAVNHAAAEVCNSVDDDCNGTVDDAYAKNAPTWYVDADKDQSGDPGTSIVACKAPAGYVAAAGDCDDASAAVRPGALETCAPGDEDCDGGADDDDPQGAPTDAPDWLADGDSDLYGDPDQATTSCAQPEGTTDAAVGLDCDDTRSDINPGSIELCDNELDDDCDGEVDNAIAQDWWPDADGDGYGDAEATPISDCSRPNEGDVTNGDDCDDEDPRVPRAAEISGNGTDDDCDPSTPDGNDTGEDTDVVDSDTDPIDTDRDTGRPIVEDSDTALDTDVITPPRRRCGCAQAPAPSVGWLALGLLALRRRRGTTRR